MTANTAPRVESRYFLHRDMYLCPIAEGGVLLDLPRGNYYALSREQMHALAAIVPGWPGAGAASTPDRDSVELAESLLTAGLLTRDRAFGKDARPVDLPAAQSRLFDRFERDRPRIELHHVLRFVSSWLSASVCLKWMSLDRAVARVRRRKARRARDTANIDLKKMQDLLRVFHWLQPVFYTAKDKCLFDSLVLTEFLSRYRIYPAWVIGVKAFAPFSAHSWVQQGALALNEFPERLNAFRPIVAA